MIKVSLAIETTLADLIEEMADALYYLNIQVRRLSKLEGFEDRIDKLANECATVLESQAHRLDRCASVFHGVRIYNAEQSAPLTPA